MLPFTVIKEQLHVCTFHIFVVNFLHLRGLDLIFLDSSKVFVLFIIISRSVDLNYNNVQQAWLSTPDLRGIFP